MNQKDILWKATEKKALSLCRPMGVNGGGHLGLGVLVQWESGLFPSRDYTWSVWLCCGWHVLEELSGSGDVTSGGGC